MIVIVMTVASATKRLKYVWLPNARNALSGP